jgi:DNA polymerase III alpha subunit
MIKENHYKEIDLLSLDMEDPKVYEMLSDGIYKGCISM